MMRSLPRAGHPKSCGRRGFVLFRPLHLNCWVFKRHDFERHEQSEPEQDQDEQEALLSAFTGCGSVGRGHLRKSLRRRNGSQCGVSHCHTKMRCEGLERGFRAFLGTSIPHHDAVSGTNGPPAPFRGPQSAFSTLCRPGDREEETGAATRFISRFHKPATHRAETHASGGVGTGMFPFRFADGPEVGGEGVHFVCLARFPFDSGLIPRARR